MDPQTIRLIQEILCMIVVIVGMVIDLRTMKIPNLLTFPAAAVGILLNAYAGYRMTGVEGACGQGLDGILGWFLGALITVGFSILPIGSGKNKEKLGMGDAKLMAAVGAFLGWKLALITFFYFCLVFGAISTIVLLKVVPWNALWFLVMSTFMGAKVAPKIDATKLNQTRKKPIPAGVAIAIGTLLAIVFEQQTINYFLIPS
jgi:prepilin signal peptidase PulO-like enzyme (type II secretory pathway)